MTVNFFYFYSNFFRNELDEEVLSYAGELQGPVPKKLKESTEEGDENSQEEEEAVNTEQTEEEAASTDVTEEIVEKVEEPMETTETSEKDE